MHSALPARLLVDDTHAYILTDCEGGNPVSAPGVGGNVGLVAVDLGRQPKPVKCSPHLELAVRPCESGDISQKMKIKNYKIIQIKIARK